MYIKKNTKEKQFSIHRHLESLWENVYLWSTNFLHFIYFILTHFYLCFFPLLYYFFFSMHFLTVWMWKVLWGVAVCAGYPGLYGSRCHTPAGHQRADETLSSVSLQKLCFYFWSVFWSGRRPSPPLYLISGICRWWTDVCRSAQCPVINLMSIRGELSPVSSDTQHEVTEAASGTW